MLSFTELYSWFSIRPIELLFILSGWLIFSILLVLRYDLQFSSISYFHLFLPLFITNAIHFYFVLIVFLRILFELKQRTGLTATYTCRMIIHKLFIHTPLIIYYFTIYETEKTNSFDPMESTGLMAAVGGFLALVFIGTGLGLGLGIGLHGDSGNLTLVTTTSTTSTTDSTTVSTTTTLTTTTASTSSSYQGTLTSSSAVYGGVNQSTTNYTYEAINVYPTSNGSYTFTSTGDSGLQFYGYLYNNTFVPSNPQTNLIARSDNSSGASQFNLTSTLQSLTDYVLVVTTANRTSTGSFNITATGPGTIYFTRRNVFSQVVNYGSTINNGADQATNGLIVINTNNVVQGVDGTLTTGYVGQVSMSFFSAPTASSGLIYVYVMNRTGTTLTFTPNAIYQIPSTSITATTGVQTFTLPRNQLPVVTGQYVGVGQSTGGGSLAGVQNQALATLTPTNFTSLSAATFTNVTTGAAYLYQIFLFAAVAG
ncbi:hypothetical protein I4U23_013667 [Adineta vaga]|nr:hypothetical protein I4U23_013667 [Adineta vaga]